VQVKFAMSMLTTEWVVDAEKFVLAVGKLCTRLKMNSTDMISMAKESKSLSRRMDRDRHRQTVVDLEADLVADDLDHEADPAVDQVVIDDQDHEVAIVEEVVVEVEAVADDPEVDLRSKRAKIKNKIGLFLGVSSK